MTKTILVLLCAILMVKSAKNKTTTSKVTKKAAKEATIIENFDIGKLDEFVKAKRYVLVTITNGGDEGIKLQKIQTKLNKLYSSSGVTFLPIDATKLTAEDFDKFNFKPAPSIYIYIDGHKKHFSGELKFENLKIWIKELFEAKPRIAKSLNDIAAIDRHYFVYVAAGALKSRKQHFDTLAKMISPLSIYSGFNKAELDKLLKGEKMQTPVFVYQEYSDNIRFIDPSSPIEKEAEIILSNEFPEWLNCQPNTLKFITQFKIPGLVYFAENSTDPKWELIKKVAKPYKEFFISILATPDNKNRCSQFLRDFLNVKRTPDLRILSMNKQIKRYRFIGDFDEQHLEYFFSNYVNGNLKSYKLNQKIYRTKVFRGVSIANYDTFKEALKDVNRTYLFYVYDKTVKTLRKDLKAIAAVQKELENTKTLKIYSINHDKNDLDGFYNNALPFVFMIIRQGKLHTFNNPKITQKALMEFITNNVPYIKPKSSDPSTDL